MTAALGEMLEHVLAGEPALADEVNAVFRRADELRRRRTRLLLAAGAMITGTIVLAGYLLTTTLLPARGVTRALGTADRPAAVPVPSTISDPVLAVLAPVVDAGHVQIVPRPPQRGFGWRQYSVLTADGAPRGTVEVAVYGRPDGLCFPRPDGHDGCASADRVGGVDYLRYDDADPDWQVNETIARQVGSGRTVALMASGERADVADGRPALSGSQIERLATGAGLLAAFGAREQCDGPSAGACPVFKVPVPSE